jgi:hypothetical protein
LRNDINGKELVVGSIFDIKQTVNGEDLFVIFSLNPLSIKYGRALDLEYQYDKTELLDIRQPYMDHDETEMEIVGNVSDDHDFDNLYDYIDSLRK